MPAGELAPVYVHYTAIASSCVCASILKGWPGAVITYTNAYSTISDDSLLPTKLVAINLNLYSRPVSRPSSLTVNVWCKRLLVYVVTSIDGSFEESPLFLNNLN